MSRVLVDTNVLIYAIDEDSAFCERSQKVLYNPNLDLFTTSKNISELIAVLTKGRVMSMQWVDVLSVVEAYSSMLTVLYPSSYSFSVFKRLLQEHKPTGLKVHDFEIVSIGIAQDIYQIATFNTKDFNGSDEINLIPV